MVVRPPEIDLVCPQLDRAAAFRVKMRLEDPVSRFFRYPLARWIVRGLVRTPITPDQVTLVQPLLAALAGWLIVSEERWRLLLAVAIFEVRSILDCVDGTLARAKKLVSPWGHAVDGLADWLSVLFLYAGIALHFQAHPPLHDRARAAYVAPGVIGLALLQGAIRSFASDYYKQKYVSIFAGGRDATVEALREKTLALGPGSGAFARAEVLIGRIGHRVFEREWLDPRRSRTSTTEGQVRELRRLERAPLTRLILGLWSLSNGDAFVTLVCLSVVVGRLWEGQVLFASAGLLWIASVIALNGWFLRSAARRGGLTSTVLVVPGHEGGDERLARDDEAAAVVEGHGVDDLVALAAAKRVDPAGIPLRIQAGDEAIGGVAERGAAPERGSGRGVVKAGDEDIAVGRDGHALDVVVGGRAEPLAKEALAALVEARDERVGASVRGELIGAGAAEPEELARGDELAVRARGDGAGVLDVARLDAGDPEPLARGAELGEEDVDPLALDRAFEGGVSEELAAEQDIARDVERDAAAERGPVAALPEDLPVGRGLGDEGVESRGPREALVWRESSPR